MRTQTSLRPKRPKQSFEKPLAFPSINARNQEHTHARNISGLREKLIEHVFIVLLFSFSL
jgi:hypothetical protein